MSDERKSLPIGLFDSGVGGLTVLKEIVAHLPNENVIYLADTAHLPYGEKSPEAIVRYTLENGALLFQQNIKLLIIACHTASSHALKSLQKVLPIPILGVIDAGIQKLVQIKKNAQIAVLGTTRTIESGVYQSLIAKQCENIKIFPIACPLFVPLIEEGQFDPKAFSLIANHYLSPLKTESIDAALLACTHYPLIQSHIQKILGAQVTLIDPAKTVAEQAHNWLKNNHCLNPQAVPPVYQFYATDQPERFFRLSRLFFNGKVKEVKKIEKNKNL